jgi:photosystem II stability/assembly factor-like uncharacterized protein
MQRKRIAIILTPILVVLVGLIIEQTTLFESSNRAEALEEASARAKPIELRKKWPKPDRPEAAMAYRKALRSEKNGKFSYPDAYRFAAMRAARQKLARTKQTDPPVWQERGPYNVGGRTRAIAIHPLDDNKWWVAAVGGGIWHTTNAGASWNAQMDDQPNIATTTITLCTSQPDILYAGTGEGFYNYDAISGDGVFKTTDGGQTWRQLPATAGNSEFRYVNRVIVDPNDPDVVLAATNSGVYRSSDGGTAWMQVYNRGRAQQIIASPDNFNVQYTAIYGFGIIKSTDAGRTWQVSSNGLRTAGRLEIAIAPQNNALLYAAVAAPSGALDGFYRSENSGTTWQELNGDGSNWLGRQGWYDNTLAVSPLNSNEVIVGGIDLFSLTVINDNYVSQRLTNWFQGGTLPYVHADQHYLVLHQTGDNSFTIIVANDGGIHFSADGGNSWEDKNNGYNVTQYYDGDRNPLREQYIGGTQDNGTHISLNYPANQNTPWQEVLGGDGFDCVWDKYDPGTVYGTLYSSRIYKSTDGGENFTGLSIPESNIFHTPLAINPFDPLQLITISELSGSNRLYISADAGTTWQLHEGVNFSAAGIIKLAFCRNDENVIWAGSWRDRIYISRDKGQTWALTTTISEASSGPITGISTSARNPGRVYVSFGVSGNNRLFRSEDYGQNWSNITGDIPDVPVLSALEMDYDADEIWAGTDIGVFRTTNGGETWLMHNGNLPATAIWRLKNHGKEILAVTHGRGMFTIRNERLADFSLPDTPPKLTQLSYANPQNRAIEIRFITRSVHDSIHVLVNDRQEFRYGRTEAYSEIVEQYIPAAEMETADVSIIGFIGAEAFLSNNESITLLHLPQEEIEVSFTIGAEEFISSDFRTVQENGFSQPGIQTDHPYAVARQYYAYLRTPFIIGKNPVLAYRDIAIIEPGEEESVYPEEGMYDYVAIEASSDGENWQNLIVPYDARFDDDWLSAYENNLSITPDLFVQHEHNISGLFAEGTTVNVRLRLFSDPLVVGWGWMIDQFSLRDTTSGSEPGPVTEFALIGNYPNPFNQSTAIQFRVNSNTPATLEIYNISGQRVITVFSEQIWSATGVNTIFWNGRNRNGATVASGTYIYTLRQGGQRSSKKMLLLR